MTNLPAKVDELWRQTAYLEGFISNEVNIQPPSESARPNPPDSDERLRITLLSKDQLGEYRFTFNDGEVIRCFLAMGGIAGYATELASIEDDNPRYAAHIELIKQWYDKEANP